jgi:hypothetical protein
MSGGERGNKWRDLKVGRKGKDRVEEVKIKEK